MTNLDDTTHIVDDSGDIEGTIEREAADHTMVVLGATEQSILARLVADSLQLNVVDGADNTVFSPNGRRTARLLSDCSVPADARDDTDRRHNVPVSGDPGVGVCRK
jgi:hypothetical protein